MDNLRSVIELLFLRRDIKEVLGTLRSVKAIDEGSKVVDIENFKKLYFSRDEYRYSGNQLNSLFEITNDTWSKNKILEQTEEVKMKVHQNAFNVLSNLTSQMLISKGGEPQCRYEEYLRWEEASKLIGDDVLVTNFLAAEDFKNNLERTDFAWPAYILTNNTELKGVMSKGLAELHNHLKGSSLVFTLSWLAVMNYPKTYGHKMFSQLKNYDGDYREIHLAAFIRAILYKRICGIKDESADKLLKGWIRQNSGLDYISINLAEIQSFIERMRLHSSAKSLDYAIPSHLPMNVADVDSRKPLIGERWLLYHCFQTVNNGASQTFETLLYTYLIIKTKFRYAMVQVNGTIGFENFQYYDGKKSNLLKVLTANQNYKKSLQSIGMRLPLQGSFVTHIEYRITPELTESELRSSLDEAEATAIKAISHGYIIHFIKEEDKTKLGINNVESGLICRNHARRIKLAKEAAVVMQLLKDGEERIIGIDAANSEFYCRPEVFGTAFRKLRHVSRNPINSYFNKQKPLQLGVTYHVGEDFYDIIDGLRAVDEAVKFLNLKSGDRIGHGTALGIDVLHYYEEKHFTVVMPKQVLLDNMAWLLDKMSQYNVTDESGFRYEVQKKFSSLSMELYGWDLNLRSYINSWLLRGDEPSLYKTVGQKKPTRRNIIDIYQINMDNTVAPARNDINARQLYHRYHYDYMAKYKGSKSEEWKIEAIHRESFVKILNTIQEKMQYEIAYSHIAVECNPTSNLRIGNIPKYVSHPIVRFNNEGLIRTDGEKVKSAQISVSINTDDAGIFATSLEKEFTLMALALEKERNDKGEPVYQQRSVYRWLEQIRESAFERKFESIPEKEEKKENDLKGLHRAVQDSY